MGSDINHLARQPQIRPHLIHALERCDSIVAVSWALRDKVLELGIDPTRVVVRHNAVNGDLFCPRDRLIIRNQLGLPTNRRILLYVGNLVPEKGVDVLLEAMSHVHRRHPDVELRIVGRGSSETELRRRAAELGLTRSVHFEGSKAHDNIALWMGAADVFCLPSRREGCPNVVLEALASGRPVVASRVGGVPELLNDRNGIMARAGEPEDLADCLCRALAVDWDAQSLRSSVKQLTWRSVGEFYHETLVHALNERKRSEPVSDFPSLAERT
jgi:glycosyltransferase involved in cell wall biosynthesis